MSISFGSEVWETAVPKSWGSRKETTEVSSAVLHGGRTD